jgi:hypothetical protein
MTRRLRAFAADFSLGAALLAILAAALGGCSGVSVQTDTASAEVSRAQTYAFLGGDSLDEPNPLADKTLKAELDRLVLEEIGARGLRSVAEAQKPDVLLRYWVKVATETPMTPTTVGAPAPPDRHPDMPAFREGLLVVDLLRPSDRDVLWRGTVSLRLRSDREKTLADLEQGLARALKDLPRAAR